MKKSIRFYYSISCLTLALQFNTFTFTKYYLNLKNDLLVLYFWAQSIPTINHQFLIAAKIYTNQCHKLRPSINLQCVKITIFTSSSFSYENNDRKCVTWNKFIQQPEKKLYILRVEWISNLFYCYRLISNFMSIFEIPNCAMTALSDCWEKEQFDVKNYFPRLQTKWLTLIKVMNFD